MESYGGGEIDRNGKEEGIWEGFYGNGKILWRGNFRNGVLIE